MISIELPVTNGKHLHALLESVREQSYQNYEVVAITSLSNNDVLREYDVKIIPKSTGLLEARSIAHSNSRGERALILDETRLLKSNALDILSKQENKMVAIRENELSHSLLGRLAQLDKEISWRNNKGTLGYYVLPRFFDSSILTHTFGVLREELGGKFSGVVHPDHQLIFTESARLTASVGFVQEPLISHVSDDTMETIIKKYYRYGRTEKILSDTKYSRELKTSNRIRKTSNIWTNIQLFTLFAIRGVPYFLGKL